MLKEKPDHHDAELALRVYDMRREAVMRAFLAHGHWPESFPTVSPLICTA